MSGRKYKYRKIQSKFIERPRAHHVVNLKKLFLFYKNAVTKQNKNPIIKISPQYFP